MVGLWSEAQRGGTRAGRHGNTSNVFNFAMDNEVRLLLLSGMDQALVAIRRQL